MLDFTIDKMLKGKLLPTASVRLEQRYYVNHRIGSKLTHWAGMSKVKNRKKSKYETPWNELN